MLLPVRISGLLGLVNLRATAYMGGFHGAVWWDNQDERTNVLQTGIHSLVSHTTWGTIQYWGTADIPPWCFLGILDDSVVLDNEVPALDIVALRGFKRGHIFCSMKGVFDRTAVRLVLLKHTAHSKLHWHSQPTSLRYGQGGNKDLFPLLRKL